MKINGLGMESKPFHGNKSESQEVHQKNNKDTGAGVKDEYIPSNQREKKVTYEKPKIDHSTIQRLKGESEQAYQHLRQMVEKLLKEQGLTFQEMDKLEINEETRVEAQSMIAEGGPLSPEKLSDRLVEFAKAISGGDKDKIELLRNAIKEGFSAVEKIFGGELPEISKRTFELVMEKLDKWAEE